LIRKVLCMSEADRISQIRSSERESHIAMYSAPAEHPWLNRPVKSVMEMLPNLDTRKNLRILDLGCGTGRNSIAIAKYFHKFRCTIDCVDILDIAIEKLAVSSEENQVGHMINGILSSIDDYPIWCDSYDSIVAVSALEHVATEAIFHKKLLEIRSGIVSGGTVCLVLNSNIREIRKNDQCFVSPQFEVNLSADRLNCLLNETFTGWKILKASEVEQSYDIPRGKESHTLETTVITFVAQKP